MRVRGTSQNRSGLWRPLLAILAAQGLVLQALLLATLGAAQVARAGAFGPEAVICLTHDTSAPTRSDDPDGQAACLKHCVLCVGIHAAVPAHGVPVRAAQRVGEVLRFHAAHVVTPKPRETSSASPRGPPLAA
jgi:hypothetical protein